MKTVLTVGLKAPGFHRWIDAPEAVGFLRNEHRHIFSIRVGLVPNHDDRDYEFFIEKKALARILDACYSHNGHGYQFEYRSCEMIAKDIMNLNSAYFYCEVTEDDENGATVFKEDNPNGVCKCNHGKADVDPNLAGCGECDPATTPQSTLQANDGPWFSERRYHPSLHHTQKLYPGQIKSPYAEVAMEEREANKNEAQNGGLRLGEPAGAMCPCCGRHIGHWGFDPGHPTQDPKGL